MSAQKLSRTFIDSGHFSYWIIQSELFKRYSREQQLRRRSSRKLPGRKCIIDSTEEIKDIRHFFFLEKDEFIHRFRSSAANAVCSDEVLWWPLNVFFKDVCILSRFCLGHSILSIDSRLHFWFVFHIYDEFIKAFQRTNSTRISLERF